MPSKKLWTKCNTCDKAIATSAKTCPQCGAKQKHSSLMRWVCGSVLVLIVLSIIVSGNDKSATTSASNEMVESASVAVKPKLAAGMSEAKKPKQTVSVIIPPEQTQFINVVEHFANEYKKAKNELQQSALRDERRIAIRDILSTYSARSWVGTINKLSTDTDGNAILSVRIAPKIEIQTWNNGLSDLIDGTLIDKGSPLYAVLIDLSVGRQVEFSGSFLSSDNDFVYETSLTIDGSMRSPEFLFIFSTVKPL